MVILQTFIHKQFIFFQVENKNFSVWDLEKHPTKDNTDYHVNGELTVIWRDWDNLIKNHPKMVYVNSINPGEIKGPHIHKNRFRETSFSHCIKWNCGGNTKPNYRNCKSFSFSRYCMEAK